MSTELIINASLPETRIALMENGEIQDLLIERASGKGIVGNIYKGRVTRVLPGMQAAFVDIGLEKAAFLYVDDVFVHSEIWEAEEGVPDPDADVPSERKSGPPVLPVPLVAGASDAADDVSVSSVEAASTEEAPLPPARVDDAEVAEWAGEISGDEDAEEDEDEDADDDHGPVGMCPPPGEGDEGDPQGTVRPESAASSSGPSEGGESQPAQGPAGEAGGEGDPRRRRHRRGRRGGRFRKRGPGDAAGAEGEAPVAVGAEGASVVTGVTGAPVSGAAADEVSDFYQSDDSEQGSMDSDRSALTEQHQAASLGAPEPGAEVGASGRPEIRTGGPSERPQGATGRRPEFKEPRARDRRIKGKGAPKSVRAQANIQDLLKEGQEVIVQVAKDPIATKGARLTCHISLPGRHLVCMPTIDHVGVSRRIERDDERRKLREYVERYRPKKLGFIVRTASGKNQSEKRIKQDIDYLTRLWSEIREKAAEVTAPALVYEDLNSVLRAIRDWVTEDIDKIIVDSRYHFNDIQRFVSHFMPSLKQKVELYHGDVPIFDAYNISTELARGLERKVWLKSGGYLVVDQAEALVAIDVNTGRFVGKKNLEDTILKTNLEAVQEIAYQLRLRNCGGIIILDLIDMEKEENKQRVYRALEEALKKDRARPSILKISELGLVEMTRKRTRDTMVRALCDSCSHCEGKGFVKSKTTVAYEVLRELERVGIERDVARVLVQASPDVIDILAIDERDTLDQLERRYRKQVYLQAVADYHMERFEVSSDKREKGERGMELPAGDDDRGPRQNQQQDRGRSGGGRNRDRGRGRDRNDRDRGDKERGGAVNVRPVDGSATPSLPLPLPRPLTESIIQVGGQVDGEIQDRPMAPQVGAPKSDDDFYTEEDRLAFLRAQAAQDAALARLGAGGVTPVSVGGRGPGGGLGRGPSVGPRQAQGQGAAKNGESEADRGKRGRRGRRGGRFRRGRDEAGQGQGSEQGPPKIGGRSPGQGIITPVGSSPVNSGSTSDAGGSGGNGGGDTSGGGDTGGGNHSTPPAV